MVNHTSEEEKNHRRSMCNWECEHAQKHRHTLRAHQIGPDSLTSRLKTFTHKREYKCDIRVSDVGCPYTHCLIINSLKTESTLLNCQGLI